MILRGDGGREQRVVLSDVGLIPGTHRAAAGAPLPVTSETMLGLPVFSRAISIASEGVAGLQLNVARGKPPLREVVTGTRQARLFRDGLYPDGFRFLETLEASLTARGNGYVWKVKVDGIVVALYALHPDQVEPRWSAKDGMTYLVRALSGCPTPPGLVTSSRSEVVVDEGTILHVRGPGSLGGIAPSPVQRYRREIGRQLARGAWDEGMYERGMQPGLVITFPATTTATQAREQKALLEGEHAGVANWQRAMVLGGGAQVGTVSLSPVDAQFVETMQLGAIDASRIMRVQASLLEASKTDKPVTPEHDFTRHLRFDLAPRLYRIESAFFADPDLFGPGSPTYPWFDASGFVRGDVATERASIVALVQAGVWLQDEGRAAFGFPPLPGGVGSIPQATPVGGAPNPAAIVPTEPPREDDDDDEDGGA